MGLQGRRRMCCALFTHERKWSRICDNGDTIFSDLLSSPAQSSMSSPARTMDVDAPADTSPKAKSYVPLAPFPAFIRLTFELVKISQSFY